MAVQTNQSSRLFLGGRPSVFAVRGKPESALETHEAGIYGRIAKPFDVRCEGCRESDFPGPRWPVSWGRTGAGRRRVSMATAARDYACVIDDRLDDSMSGSHTKGES